jgi:hypothetical protein
MCTGAAGGVILDSETAPDDDEPDEDDGDRAADGDGDLAAFQQDGQEGGTSHSLIEREREKKKKKEGLNKKKKKQKEKRKKKSCGSLGVALSVLDHSVPLDQYQWLISTCCVDVA